MPACCLNDEGKKNIDKICKRCSSVAVTLSIYYGKNVADVKDSVQQMSCKIVLWKHICKFNGSEKKWSSQTHKIQCIMCSNIDYVLMNWMPIDDEALNIGLFWLCNRIDMLNIG